MSLIDFSFFSTDYQAVDTLLYLIEKTYYDTKSKALEKTKDTRGVARSVGGSDNVKVATTNLRVCDSFLPAFAHMVLLLTMQRSSSSDSRMAPR